jgi:hypothetical protein
VRDYYMRTERIPPSASHLLTGRQGALGFQEALQRPGSDEGVEAPPHPSPVAVRSASAIPASGVGRITGDWYNVR